MQKQLKNTIEILENEGTILYPTDTVWGLGCDATNTDAVKKIYQLKQRDDSKALICLVSDIDMLKKYLKSTPTSALDIISTSTKPTTIIYDSPIGFAENLIASDNTIAIRIPNNEFCKTLIEKFGKPIVSTSANISGEPTPKSFKEISAAILKDVDYVVNLQSEKTTVKPSTIIKINSDGLVTVIRE